MHCVPRSCVETCITNIKLLFKQFFNFETRFGFLYKDVLSLRSAILNGMFVYNIIIL